MFYEIENQILVDRIHGAIIATQPGQMIGRVQIYVYEKYHLFAITNGLWTALKI